MKSNLFPLHFAVLLTAGLMISSCGKKPEKIPPGAGSPAANPSSNPTREMMRLRKAGSIKPADYAVLNQSLESGSDSERLIAISVVEKHLNECCFAVDGLVALLKDGSSKSTRLLAIKTLGDLGACAKSAEAQLNTIIAAADPVEVATAQDSLKQINGGK